MVSAGTLLSQDIHFSQFYASPHTLNPAETGNYDGDWRIMNNHRRQWAAITPPYSTTTIGYDKQFYRSNDKISAGGIFINDKSGDGKLLVNKFFLSGAYHKQFGGHNLSAGLQAGYVMKSFSAQALSFPDQWNSNNGQFDTSLPTGDNSLSQQSNYADFNAGVLWGTKMNSFEPYAGISFFHLSSPKETFLNGNEKISIRQNFHGGAKIILNEKFYLQPDFQFIGQKKANNMLSGFNIGYVLPDSETIKTIYGGTFFRNGISRNSDAFIITSGLKYKNFLLGLSYDINISDLKLATRNKGAIEFSLIYIAPSSLLNKITVPCERM
jgi:type IX secretion system PorP/SprF family membrane protein